MDTVPFKGRICHLIRVEFESKPIEIDYFIDVSEFLERKRVYHYLKPEGTITIEYEDYRKESGVPIAYREVHFESGKWTSTTEYSAVRMNAGVMPWMFKTPQALASDE